ncbi:cryptochrome DASH, chloroplastic/mitochondrial isoform X2 [Selaginella moellendorffii]|uniref:cryptochrome DASH, chloroplastic/mitochondrial isoform X2 n=1 Tax=Selaginella moellendorffii TaxID=88036 RepID=UPI000D1CA59F|nr:cryptochrome DASH, chloroplastic/mitochondrial isoform X2 [Selaginella moellendorffii]|eukprot:XP_024541514.1 cryptochrome DASH, chloroplastic/mitochondrial isoform X2 [Selaginella moellendorffii]
MVVSSCCFKRGGTLLPSSDFSTFYAIGVGFRDSRLSAAAPKVSRRLVATRAMADAVESMIQRYSSAGSSRNGKGVSIMWFRNDLRIVDNEALFKAWASSSSVLPVYCVDPRHFGTTHYFKFPKTGELRAQFLLESLVDLKKNLKKRGLDLVIRSGNPEFILPSLVEAVGADTIYAQEETCSEELQVEKAVKKSIGTKAKLELVWGTTMYHLNDLPFTTARLPDVYTQFRKAVESSSRVRPCLKLPQTLGPLPDSLGEKVGDLDKVPNLSHLGLRPREQSSLAAMQFAGGETAAIQRLCEYFWTKNCLRNYKETRNGMLGADYSTKFSPWLASGSISPRFIHEEVKRYEKERTANNSTYWVLFELIWRDYFRFLSMKYGNSIFHLEGPRKVRTKSWSQDKTLFEAWRTGTTGYPLIDANMKELYATGFMSNRGRQIVCSFLVRDMGIDWRMGAEWFESCLLDYDPCSNYGNWTYGAGVGNDPREDRYFSIPKQAQTYDPDGSYVSHWIPQLQELPTDARHFPKVGYLKKIVPLRFSNPGRTSKTSANFRK